MAKYTISYLAPNGDEQTNDGEVFYGLKAVRDELYRLSDKNAILEGTKVYVNYADGIDAGIIHTVYIVMDGIIYGRV